MACSSKKTSLSFAVVGVSTDQKLPKKKLSDIAYWLQSILLNQNEFGHRTSTKRRPDSSRGLYWKQIHSTNGTAKSFILINSGSPPRSLRLQSRPPPLPHFKRPGFPSSAPVSVLRASTSSVSASLTSCNSCYNFGPFTSRCPPLSYPSFAHLETILSDKMLKPTANRWPKYPNWLSKLKHPLLWPQAPMLFLIRTISPRIRDEAQPRLSSKNSKVKTLLDECPQHPDSLCWCTRTNSDSGGCTQQGR